MVVAGDALEPLRRLVSQADIDAYAAVSGDHNPIHLDPERARSAGLPGTIAHGMLEMAILAQAIVRWAGPGARLVALSCRFSKPLLAGDTITCSGTVTSVEGLSVEIQMEAGSDRGERVLSHGRATVELTQEGRGGC